MSATDTIKEAIKLSNEKFSGGTKYHHQNIVNAIGCFGEIYGWSKDATADGWIFRVLRSYLVRLTPNAQPPRTTEPDPSTDADCAVGWS